MKETYIHLYFELGLEQDTKRYEIFPALSSIIIRDFFHSSDDLINGKVLKHATQPRDPPRQEISTLSIILLFETSQLRQGIHHVTCIIIVIDHLKVTIVDRIDGLEWFEVYFVELGLHEEQAHLFLLGL